MERLKKSKKLYNEAKKHVLGGLNTPISWLAAEKGFPFYVEKGIGSKVYDIDGNEYIDYSLSSGSLFLGHNHSNIVASLKETLDSKKSAGANSPQEIELAKLIKDAFPSIEFLRIVNSEIETIMSAIRIAKGATGREKIIKFEGCHHGYSDSVIIEGFPCLGMPKTFTTKGISQEHFKSTIALPFNDFEIVRNTIKRDWFNIAAVIIEPIPTCMGLVLPEGEFLSKLRKLTDEHGILLIFDETRTAFRLTWGGAQTLYEIEPDLTCFGGIIGGGFSMGLFGGKHEFMDMLSPIGDVCQAGDFLPNAISMTASIETLKILKQKDVYEKINELSFKLYDGIRKNLEDLKLKLCFRYISSMFCIFFSQIEIRDYYSAKTSNIDNYLAYFKGMLERGIYLPPSQFETCFLSLAHTEEDIDQTIKANFEVLKKILKS